MGSYVCVYVSRYAYKNSFMIRGHALNDRKKKEKSGKDGRRPISNETQPGKKEGEGVPDDFPKDMSRSEAEMLLLQRWVMKHDYRPSPAQLRERVGKNRASNI